MRRIPDVYIERCGCEQPSLATRNAISKVAAEVAVARQFFAAAEQGDLAGLEALLAHDVVLTGDGGGKVPALARSPRAQPCRAHTARLGQARCPQSRPRR